jgi:hypothetical protein
MANKELPILLVSLAKLGGMVIHKQLFGMTLDSILRLCQVCSPARKWRALVASVFVDGD